MRAIWFSQLAFLAFTFITLLSVRDLERGTRTDGFPAVGPPAAVASSAGLIAVLLLWLGMLATLPLFIFVSLFGAGWYHLPVIVQAFLDARWFF